jgi:hypothetical protein
MPEALFLDRIERWHAEANIHRKSGEDRKDREFKPVINRQWKLWHEALSAEHKKSCTVKEDVWLSD